MVVPQGSPGPLKMSDIGQYPNSGQVDSKPTQPVLGFGPHQILMQLATQVAHTKEGFQQRPDPDKNTYGLGRGPV